MITTVRECRDTRRLLAERRARGGDAYARVMEDIQTLARRGEFGTCEAPRWRIQELYEETVYDRESGDCIGREALRDMRERRRAGINLISEAGGADAITTADFANIIGQIQFAGMMEKFDSPVLIGSQLVESVPTDTAQRVIKPGVTMVGDSAEAVGENEEYPIAGIGEQFIIYPELVKYGFVMNITEETVLEDRTGLIMGQFGTLMDWMAINLEKERLGVVLGIENTYSRNGGPQQSTYANTHTQGDGDNLIATNPLSDKTALNNAKYAFDRLTDPDTGEPIMMGRSYQIVIPDALEWTLADILSVRTYETRPTLGATAVAMHTGNPINSGGRTYTPLSNQYVKSVGGSDTSWWMGDFKRAFKERVQIPPQVQMEDRSGPLAFSRDIIARSKVRRKSRVVVDDWRPVQKHTAT